MAIRIMAAGTPWWRPPGGTAAVWLPNVTSANDILVATAAGTVGSGVATIALSCGPPVDVRPQAAFGAGGRRLNGDEIRSARLFGTGC